MPREVSILRQQWARQTRYEVVEGSIRPGSGAELQLFDPWDAYEQCSFQNGPTEPPHVALMNMVEELGGEVSPRRTLSKASETAVTKWCSRHGLLGVLLMDVQAMRLAPRNVDVDGLDGEPVQRFHWRMPSGWKSARREAADYSPPGVLLSPEGARPPMWEPFDVQAARYFPSVPEAERETFAYPTPLTADFWRIYCEPLDEFVRYARRISRAMSSLKAQESLSDSNDRGFEATPRGWGEFQVLLSSTHLVPLLRDGRHLLRWVSGSLIGVLASMAMLDLVDGKARLYNCPMCGRYFRATRVDNRYCGDSCRRRAARTRSFVTNTTSEQTSPAHPEHDCEECGKRFEVSKPNRRYCSVRCQRTAEMRRRRERLRRRDTSGGEGMGGERQ